jgi:hypothetical protein
MYRPVVRGPRRAASTFVATPGMVGYDRARFTFGFLAGVAPASIQACAEAVAQVNQAAMLGGKSIRLRIHSGQESSGGNVRYL